MSLQATQEFLQRQRDSQVSPEHWSYMDDRTLYFTLKQAVQIPVEYQNEAFHSSAVEQMTAKGEEQESPDHIGFLRSSLDYIIDEDSPDWWKAAYTRSLTGVTEELITGKR